MHSERATELGIMAVFLADTDVCMYYAYIFVHSLY